MKQLNEVARMQQLAGILKESLLKQSNLSSSEYQKAKLEKGFNSDNYKWDSDSQLYKKLNEQDELESSPEQDKSSDPAAPPTKPTIPAKPTGKITISVPTNRQ